MIPNNHAVKNANGRVLVVDDHASARESLAFALGHAGHDVTCCSSGAEALQHAGGDAYDCIVTDLQMPGMDGIELIAHLGKKKCRARIVVVTAHASVSTAVDAMRHGAFDYIEKPFNLERIESLVSQAVDHRRLDSAQPDNAASLNKSPEGTVASFTPSPMVGSSRVMQNLRELIERFAPTDETVLITGESGTGKEVVARMLHAESGRKSGPWVSLNCPVLSPQLMESELFGHERGAFTGAEQQRIGRFELARHGTLLLDEVTEIDLPLQAKLLRVLQERSFERVGSNSPIETDARVVATTNRCLEAAVAEGRFREDLFYRLAVLPLHVPALRDRKEDIPELAEHFLHCSAKQLGREPCHLKANAVQTLVEYNWPGNVRELENVIKRASVLGSGADIEADQLRRWLPHSQTNAPAATNDEAIQVGMSLQEIEQRMIEATLQHYDGHRAKTAEALGIGVRTLSGKLRQYGYAPRENAPNGSR